ncbi:MAG: hypothetical protein R3F59_28925 [Myxococcota bacterium]
MTDHNVNSRLALVGLVVGLGLVPGLALAHGGGAPAPTLVTIDNRFDGKGEVFVDGRFQGIVAGHTQGTFPTGPGYHNVTVKRPDTHFVLASASLGFNRGTNTMFRVDAPRGTLRVTNAGEVALKLRAEGTNSVWVNPGGTVTLNVQAGNVDVFGSIRDPRGEWDALKKTEWVEPGVIRATTLRPDSTVLVVTNYERYPVHALVDGKDIGWIEPGRTTEAWLRPGRADLVFLDRNGRVRTTTSVQLQKGEDTRVLLQPTAPMRPGVVVSASLPSVIVSMNLHGRAWSWDDDRRLTGYRWDRPDRDVRYGRDDDRDHDHHGDDRGYSGYRGSSDDRYARDDGHERPPGR